MIILVKLIGLYVVIMGIICCLSPKIIKDFITSFGKGNRIYLAAIIRILIGTMLILAAPECKLAWVVFTLGILSLLGSLLIVILGKDRVRARIIWWAERPALVMRILGLVALAIGALLIYSA